MDTMNVSLSQVKTALRNPRLTCREVNSLCHRLVPRWDSRRTGTDFMGEDWDNLLILDACRYDIFAAENTIPGRLEKRRSKASSTLGFLRTNVDGVDLTDTVYVTANGQIHNYQHEIDANFHDIVPLYAECWDDTLGTVHPADVTERTIEAEDTYPNKRLLVHYVQPHFPFIAAETNEDKHRINESEYEHSFWRRVFTGQTELTRDEIWDAYRETLLLALEHAEQLVEELSGKTVVTSDHGNMFGERGFPIPIKEWGHPSQVYHRPVVEVPWLVCDWSDRKQITAEEPRKTTLRSDPTVVEERLEAIGYK